MVAHPLEPQQSAWVDRPAVSSGWVKIHRQLLEDPVWTTATADQKAVLVTILLSASHERRQWAWEGCKFEIQPGQFVTSLASLAKRAGVSVQSVRSAIARFEKLNFLTNESTKTGRLISIRNWSTYQDQEDEPNKEANKDPTKTQQLSRMKECEKEIPYSEIISFLNEATGKSFRVNSRGTQSLIKARWTEGFRIEDFKLVIRSRVDAWEGNPEMCEYLRPQTLFGTKFEAYLNGSGPGQGKAASSNPTPLDGWKPAYVKELEALEAANGQ